MKSIRVASLAGLMALLAMAFVGAPPATAEPTGLCATEADEENPCESVISHLQGESVGVGVVLTDLGDVECNVSALGGVTEGSPLTVEASFTYTNCKGLGSCEVKEGGSALIEVLKTSHETAAVTVGTGEILVKCVVGGFLMIHCVYKGSGMEGTAKGPLLSAQESGEISIQEQPMAITSGGVLCPTTATADITVTPLSPTYIVGQMLCRIRVGGLYQDGSNEYRCKNDVGKGKGEAELITMPPM